MTTTALSLSPEQEAALADIDAIIAVRRNTMANLKAAEAETEDEDVLRDIKSAKVALSLRNLVTVNARNKVLRTASLGPVLDALKDVTDAAEAADETLQDILKILEQVTTVIQILDKLADIFS
ncbi:MAG: hypothetical protein AAFV31_14745 [Pseudomonadota bacterium]